MPVISIQQLAQDVDKKRRLVKEITRAVVEIYDVLPDKIQVFIHEVDKESWSKGGELGIDRNKTKRAGTERTE